LIFPPETRGAERRRGISRGGRGKRRYRDTTRWELNVSHRPVERSGEVIRTGEANHKRGLDARQVTKRWAR